MNNLNSMSIIDKLREKFLKKFWAYVWVCNYWVHLVPKMELPMD